MRILHLGDTASPHLRRIVTALDAAGVEQRIFTLTDGTTATAYGLDVHVVRRSTDQQGSDAGKLRYLLAVPAVRQAARDYVPDIVHAHYATSYGLLGALSGHRPFVLSVWGSDVLLFPQRGAAQRALVKRVLRRADRVLATSGVLAAAFRDLSDVPVTITPFGVDMDLFRAERVECPYFPSGTLIIGTVKSLATVYGIDVLIRAFASVKAQRPLMRLGLLIAGDGPQQGELERMVTASGVRDQVRFTGRIDFDRIAQHHAMIDVFANLSRSESYGVSVLEAMASGKPVVASRVGGLPDLVAQGDTGYLVDADDVPGATQALLALVDDAALRARMGAAGRARVLERYDAHKLMDRFLDVYRDLVTDRSVRG